MRVKVCPCFCASTKPGPSWALNKYLLTGRTSVVRPPLPTSAASSSHTLPSFYKETQGPGLPPHAEQSLPSRRRALAGAHSLQPDHSRGAEQTASPISAKHVHSHTHKGAPGQRHPSDPRGTMGTTARAERRPPPWARAGGSGRFTHFRHVCEHPSQ